MALSNHIDAAGYYDHDAAGFADRYDSVTFEAVHSHLLTYLPATGRVLDIGAGSGRDARALAARGLEVTAVEPSLGLRAIGLANTDGVDWVDDRLPRLASLANDARSYDFILCSAVLMLIAHKDLAASFVTLTRLLAPAARLAVNLRAPMPDEPRDLFFEHRETDVLAAAGAAGLACIYRAAANDALQRHAYRWRSFIFGRESAAHCGVPECP